MSRTHLVVPDMHSHPDHNNDRADWLGKLILDIKPDVVVNLGDQWDFSSLSSYDKGKASFHGKSYKKDLDAGLDFSERMWEPIRRAKKKKPYAVFLEGNHEERQSRVLEQHSDGGMSANGIEFGNSLEFVRQRQWINAGFPNRLHCGEDFPMRR